MRLFVIARHAESVLNLEQRVNGNPSRRVDLTEHGREEARQLGMQVANIPLHVPSPGGETLDAAARRYAAGFTRLLERPEASMLVVCHEIPLRYALNGA